MRPQSPHPSPQAQLEHLTDAKASELRRHPAAREVGYGWLRIALQESIPDRVLLVSALAPVSVVFLHGSGDLDRRRASLSASAYACQNPQQTCDDAFDVVQGDEIIAPTTM